MWAWWFAWRVPILLLIVLAVWWIVFRAVTPSPVWIKVTSGFALCGERTKSAAGCVIDGDTVILGRGSDRRSVRLTGFDTPELNGACEAENAIAITARNRLHQWLGEGPFEWDGGHDPPRDLYGRELRTVRRSHTSTGPEYLADVMIESGLAARGGRGGDASTWCE